MIKFSKKSSPSRCWPPLFTLKDGLGLKNILHIAELCIAILWSNAEIERVFSYLWRPLSKEYMSFSHQALEQVLQIRQVKDFSVENYDHAIKLFLSIHSNGDVRKRPRLVDGIDYPKNKEGKINTSDQPNSKLRSLKCIYQLLKEGKAIENIDLKLVPSSDKDDFSLKRTIFSSFFYLKYI